MADEQNTVPAELLALRASIDNIDAALIHMLAERFRCTRSSAFVASQLMPISIQILPKNS